MGKAGLGLGSGYVWVKIIYLSWANNNFFKKGNDSCFMLKRDMRVTCVDQKTIRVTVICVESKGKKKQKNPTIGFIVSQELLLLLQFGLGFKPIIIYIDLSTLFLCCSHS